MKQFAIGDILSYVLPGSILLFAIQLEGTLSGNWDFAKLLNGNAATASLLWASFSFIFGILSSSLMPFVDKIVFEIHPDPRKSIHLGRFEGTVLNVFNKILGYHGDWSTQHFYMARALVREKAPQSAIESQRQGSLRQFRRNSLFPILFLLLVSGKWLFKKYSYASIPPYIFTLFSIYILFNLIKSGIIDNRKREVNEVCAGLVSISGRGAHDSFISSKLESFLFYGKRLEKDKIIKLIEGIKKNNDIKIILSGFPSVGKTTISQALKRNGIIDDHIEAESWLKELKTREDNKTSGANPKSYELSKCIEDLNAAINDRKGIALGKYSHKQGKIIGTDCSFEYKNKGFVLDGTIFSHHKFSAFADICLFFIPKDYDRWLSLAIKRDEETRFFTHEYALMHNENKFRDILELYMNHSKNCIPVLVDQFDSNNFQYIPSAGYFRIEDN